MSDRLLSVCAGLQIFPAVLRALKNKATRVSLVEELSFNIKSNRAMLDHQQFDLVVKLINCALQVQFLDSNRSVHCDTKKCPLFNFL